MDFFDPLSPTVTIICRSQEVFQDASSIGTELLYISSSWLFYLCLFMWRGLQEHITYGFVLTSPAVSRMSGSSNLDSFCDGWQVVVQLLFCEVLIQGLFNIAHALLLLLLSSFFSIRLVCIHVHLYSSTDMTTAWKKLCFILSVRSDFHMTNSCPCLC